MVIISILLGIGLSASAGYRVFIPLLIASIAGRLGWIPLTDSFHWMSSAAAIICFATATVVEIGAFYIPVVDNILDAAATPVALVAGTLLTTSVLPVENELVKWIIGILLGGGSAGIMQVGTSMLRLASTKTTAGIGNPFLATTEHLLAVGQSFLSIFIPVLTGISVIFLLIFLVSRYSSLFFRK